MQPDLISLEITKGELRHLTGFKPDSVIRGSRMANREQRAQFVTNEIVIVLVLTAIIVGVVYALIILPTIGSSIALFTILVVVVAIAAIAFRWLRRRLSYPRALRALLEAVDQYHEIIKSVDSQAEENSHREIVTALQFLREDLVRGLKIERMVRDNKRLLANNQDLFVNHLTNLQALQVNNQAGEYAQLLNQSLQIALDVQAQVKKLQTHQK